jgi:hypothetical protein
MLVEQQVELVERVPDDLPVRLLVEIRSVIVSASTWLSASTLFRQTDSSSPIGSRAMVPYRCSSGARWPVRGLALGRSS